jgi:uncharacterized membrane protein
MTIKQYQVIKLVSVVVLAMIFSQSLVYQNYWLPVGLMVVASLVLLALRKKVKGVLADERDYATAGRAALLAIQIYGWLAAVATFIFYAFKQYNPAYEAIGLTLAFSTCLLLLAYSLIFRYYNHFSWSDKKLWYIAVVLLVFLGLAVVSLRVLSSEDNWLCQNGQWVKHGQPNWPAPRAECK